MFESRAFPYSGCILCDVRAPFTGQDVIETGALIHVVPTTEYSLELPVIVETNAILMTDESSDDSTDSSSDASEKTEAVPRYIIPARRSGQERVRTGSDQSTQRQEMQRRPGGRPQIGELGYGQIRLQ